MIKSLFKIVLTNWINLCLILCTVYVYSFVIAYSDKAFSFNDSVFSATYLIFYYGILLWGGFILCIIILDIVLFGFDNKRELIWNKLFFEWIIVSSPFVYWLFLYKEYIFFIAIISFLIGQYFRKRSIESIQVYSTFFGNFHSFSYFFQSFSTIFKSIRPLLNLIQEFFNRFLN